MLLRLLRIGALLVLTTSVSCSSTPKASGPVLAPAQGANDGPAALQLTESGENGEAYFSPDGRRVLFHGKDRPQHKHTQIYELNLDNRKERRVTHNDGENANGIYHPDGLQILYSSATDELKEDPEFINNLRRNYQTGWKSPRQGPGELDFQPYEIYLSRIDGSAIRRLTRSRGYDAEASVHPNGQRIVFTSLRGGTPDLYTMNPEGGALIRLTKDPEYDSGAFFSPDGQSLIWSRFRSDFKTAQIYIAESGTMKALPLTTKSAIHWAPFWHPNGEEIIFSSNRDDGKQFDLYAIDRRGLCLRRLSQSESDEILPSFSPDGRQVLFTSNRSGRHQIYLMEFKPPKACLDEIP